MAIGITNFERKNPSTEEWDRIGHIEWTSPLTGSVQLGDEEVSRFRILSLFSSRLPTRLTSKICGGSRTARGECCFRYAQGCYKITCALPRSRRFRYKGIEYKWKIDKDDLYVSMSSASSFTPWLMYALVCWSRGQYTGKMVSKKLWPSNFHTPRRSHRTSARNMFVKPLVSNERFLVN
jgi:hypothetical protein